MVYNLIQTIMMKLISSSPANVEVGEKNTNEDNQIGTCL